MDGNEFDQLARRLGHFASRRQTLGGLLGAALGMRGLSAAAARQREGRVGVTAPCGGVGCRRPDLGGQCFSGLQEANCGLNGEVCTDCGAGQACVPNEDFDGGSCQAVDCPAGQCRLGGACVELTDDRVCGETAAGVCRQACGGGEVCVDGECMPPPATCQDVCAGTGFTNGGCCPGGVAPECRRGDTVEACGRDAGVCRDCRAVCGTGQPFDCVEGVCACERECATGCTDPATGRCLKGIGRNSCGRGGRACKACDAGERCARASNGGTCRRRRRARG
jgi:hypothetical protein